LNLLAPNFRASRAKSSHPSFRPEQAVSFFPFAPAKGRLAQRGISLCLGLAVFLALSPIFASARTAGEKNIWKSVDFAIVKFNDEAPKSWNIYHTEKKGLLLVHLWKRYLLVDMKEQEVYEIDPQTVKPQGDNVEWSLADKPDQPLEISEWKERNVGVLQRVTFRLGKGGHILDMQLPLKPNGTPAY
jgi:hypothetical protein